MGVANNKPRPLKNYNFTFSSMADGLINNTDLPGSVTLKTPTPQFGVHDTFRHGFKSAKAEITPSHCLERSEQNHYSNHEAFVLHSLRNSQGLHMPLRLQMERRMASKIRRVAPLESSMIALETLLGNDERITVEELLNNPSDSPVVVDGRAVMERKLKLI